ncbi:neuroligin-4, Y-linked-like isoform X3 [Argiope bruennichi]|uniref:neuroligin-4, Y-linked-like isoform X3 n=1 Tax=Argiope bruennichi TaxID=94029 RepID=UPI0024958D1E|nr:neuroligin-4, Y-linked-like isoform X3 [Argiope bruennichi]
MELLLVIIYLSVSALGQEDSDYPVVTTKSGRIRGKILKLTSGKEVAAFLGIFYAEPPVGELRFKAPVPKVPWDDIYNATSFGPLCAQSKNRSHWDIETEASGKKILRRLGLWDYMQGEDCLNLNVYVPAEALPNKSVNSKPLSVMFFIHGGSYKTNGGRFYPGEWLAAAGQVIVITINYRLGVLGFLSTEDDTAKGNYGLLDQILALKWVKDNIAAFGGNSSDVTIFGNSAGGACVGLHLISPMSRGLFSKAIAQSGSPIGEWAVQRRPRMYVERLAKKLKCPDVNDSATILQCLRKIDPEQIIDKSEDAKLFLSVTWPSFQKTLEDSLMLQFAPVADGEFLLKYPTTMLQQEGSLSPVPVMVGVTRDELEVWMTKSYQDKDPSSIPFTKDLLRKYLLHLVRKDFMSGIAADVLLHAVYTEYVYRHGTTSHHKKRRQQQHKMSNGTMPYYENNSSVLPDIRTLGKIISDIDLKAPSVKLVNLLTLHPSVSVYMYEFDYASSDDVIANKYVALNIYVETCIQDLKSISKESNHAVLLAACSYLFPKDREKNNNTLGSYHESELYYIFGFPHMNLSNALRLPEDKEVSNIMIQLWTDFAKHGNPTPRGVNEENMVKNFTWRQYTEEEDCFATLGLQPFVARSYESERMTFWNHFVPLFTEYPILISPNHTKNVPFEECNFTYLLTFAGWLLAIILLILVLHLCSCKMFKNFGVMKKIPIPV